MSESLATGEKMSDTENMTEALASLANNVKPPRPYAGATRGRKPTKAAAPTRATPTRESAPEAEPTRPKRLYRHRQNEADRLHIEAKDIPAGMDWQYIRNSVYGKPDPRHVSNMMENHWRPVPASKVPPGVLAEIDGLVLCERPKYLSEEAKQEGYEIALSEVDRVRGAMMDTPANQFTRNHPSVQRIARVDTSYGDPIPSD